jgi:hypothetical protein
MNVYIYNIRVYCTVNMINLDIFFQKIVIPSLWSHHKIAKKDLEIYILRNLFRLRGKFYRYAIFDIKSVYY